MARNKHPAFKKRLNKANRNTSWAPIFAVFKKYGRGKKVHPSAFSRKRSWRSSTLKK